MTTIPGGNTAETYTARTQGDFPAYAPRRKSLIYIMGLRGVEPRTSRLSGPQLEIGNAQDHSEPRAVSASRHFRDETGNPGSDDTKTYAARTRENRCTVNHGDRKRTRSARLKARARRAKRREAGTR